MKGGPWKQVVDAKDIYGFNKKQNRKKKLHKKIEKQKRKDKVKSSFTNNNFIKENLIILYEHEATSKMGKLLGLSASEGYNEKEGSLI